VARSTRGPSGFTHLHVTSGYSLRYGASSPETLVGRAADLGLGALALTDRDGLYGAVGGGPACAGWSRPPTCAGSAAAR